jgi:hypothetical protein
VTLLTAALCHSINTAYALVVLTAIMTVVILESEVFQWKI